MKQKGNKIYIGIIILLIVLSIYLFIAKENIIKDLGNSCNKMDDKLNNIEEIKKCPEVYKELQECRIAVSSDVDRQDMANEQLVTFLSNLS